MLNNHSNYLNYRNYGTGKSFYRTSKSFLGVLKALILLSPLPFGCVGKIFSPLFFAVLLMISYIGLKQPEEKNDILYEKWLRCFFYCFLVILGLQVIPLPIFLLRILSPKAINIFAALEGRVPAFHSISLVPFETFVFGCQFLVFSLFFLIMVNIKIGIRNIISLINTIILSSVIQVIFGFLKYIQGNRNFFLFFYSYEDTEKLRYRLTGTLGNSNHFAFYLEMILPLILSLFFLNTHFFEKRGLPLREKFLALFNEKNNNILYFIAAILLGIGIFLTGSRGGVSIMILSIIVFSLFSIYVGIAAVVREKLKIIYMLILCGILLIGLQETMGRLLKTNIEKENRFNTRWPGTIAMISDFPILGMGFGTYRYSYYLYDNEGGNRWTTHAHNDYLETLSDGGIVGGALLLAVIGIIIISVYRLWWKRRHPEVRILGLGIIISLCAVVFHSFFDFSLRIPSNMFIFVLIQALGIKIANYHKKKEEFGYNE